MLFKRTVSRIAIVAISAGLSISASNFALAADASPSEYWAGPYIGVLTGVEPSNNRWTSTSIGLNNFVGVTSSSATRSLNATGGRLGGFVGWDFPVGPNLVAGVAVDMASIFGSKNTSAGIPGVPYNFPSMGITGVQSVDTVNAEQNFDASLRARLGYAASSRLLVYGTAGLALQNSDIRVICPSSVNTSSLCGVPQNQTYTKTMAGWTLGVGAETKLSEHWSANIEYRYAGYGSRNVSFFTGTNSGIDSVSARVRSSSNIITLGVAYRFGGEHEHRAETATAAAPPPPPPPPAAPMQERAPSPPPAMAQKFLAFFDFDKSNLLPAARKIVQEAAEYAKANSKMVIHVTGYTDTMGTVPYNIALSKRRAMAVKAELIRLGIPEKEINVAWKGKSDLLVQTGDQVKEPQNRRVEIVYE